MAKSIATSEIIRNKLRLVYSYSRFNTKELENAFDCFEERLEKIVEKNGEK